MTESGYGLWGLVAFILALSFDFALRDVRAELGAKHDASADGLPRFPPRRGRVGQSRARPSGSRR